MKIIRTSIRFNKVIFELIFSLSFLTITLVGNLIILAFSGIFYHLESGINPQITNYFDAIWWGFTTATSVGYGDITPVSTEGRVVAIMLMLIGTALFATFTALFAQAIMEDEFFQLQKRKSKPEDIEYLDHLKKHRDFIDQQIQQIKK